VNFPSDLRKTSMPEIPILAPNQQVVVPLEVVLGPLAGKQLKVDIRCDKGAYAGLLPVHEWDVMQPLVMTAQEFDKARSRLSGNFTEMTKTYTFASVGVTDNSSSNGNGNTCEEELLQIIKRALNVFVVQGAGVGELLFSGSVRKGLSVEEKVLATVTLLGNEDDDEKQTSFSLKLNCEDAVMCTTLNEDLKKMLLRRGSTKSASAKEVEL
jgi:hypothetical protein